MRMSDSELVAAIGTRDATALAVAYDQHAAALHAYSRSLLADPADAADIVQDTFIIAASKLDELRDPSRLRPWLFAIARNECYRRPRGRARTPGLDEAGRLTDEPANVGADAAHSELREPVAAAIARLNPGEREVIELSLRHDMVGADIADVLGVSPDQAQALVSRAHSRFEALLGTLLVARSGRSHCPYLRALLEGRHSRLNVLDRKRLSRHIERCAICGLRERRELRRALRLGLLPGAALPDELWPQVLRLVTDATPDEAAYSARVVQRAEPLGESGFPVLVRPRGSGRARYAPMAVAMVVAVALLGGGTLITTSLLRHSGPAHARAAAVDALPAMRSAGPPPSGVTPTRPAALATRPAKPAPTISIVATTSPRPTPQVAIHSPNAAVAAGTLVASPATVTLASSAWGALPSGSFTLTASGGPVPSYSITVPAAYAGVLTITPPAGSLAAGQSVRVSVVDNSAAAVSAALAITPGGPPVNVVYQALFM
jgi:RNA polymerase sigma factor (sigma-70 family)